MMAIYHEGELAVQARAGTRAMAERVGRSIRRAIPPTAAEFLRHQPLAVIASVDVRDRVWVSLLVGEPGFLRALDETTVRIETEPAPGDPLAANLQLRNEVGLLAIEFASRRRMRINGRAEAEPEGGLIVSAEEVFANCPKYIQARAWEGSAPDRRASGVIEVCGALSARQQRWIGEADTFFIGSFHPGGGADASHRGGPPGFVRVIEDNKLVWPDYAGNQMFQTLGNLEVDPRAGLLFLDFDSGSTLQLTGRARVDWDAGRAAAEAGAERMVEFEIEAGVEIRGDGRRRWRFIDYSPFNPD